MVRLEGESAKLRERNVSLEMRLLDLLLDTQQQQQQQRQRSTEEPSRHSCWKSGCSPSSCGLDALRDLRRQLRAAEREASELREERASAERRDRQVGALAGSAAYDMS